MGELQPEDSRGTLALRFLWQTAPISLRKALQEPAKERCSMSGRISHATSVRFATITELVLFFPSLLVKL